MKKKLIIPTIIYLIFLSTISAAPRFTADFYLGDRERYENKVLTFYVAYTSPWKVTFDHAVLKDYHPFTITTYYQGERGGSLYCLVHKSKARYFVRKYGTKMEFKKDLKGNPKVISKQLKAKFYKWHFTGGHEWVAIVK